MDVYLAQDWITLATPSGGSSYTIVQSEPSWLDLVSYRDIVAWLDIKRASAATFTVAYQSAVAKEESLFATMAQITPAIGASVTVTPMLQELQGGTNLAPLARWLRWSVTLPTGPNEIVFRLWIAANKPGRASLNRAAASRG